jgi:hypothetical protein
MENPGGSVHKQSAISWKPARREGWKNREGSAEGLAILCRGAKEDDNITPRSKAVVGPAP